MKNKLWFLFPVLLLAILIKPAFGNVFIVSNLKPAEPAVLMKDSLTLKGRVDINDIAIAIRQETKGFDVVVKGGGAETHYVNFNNTPIVNVLKFVSQVFDYDYKFGNNTLYIYNFRTVVFHFPFIPLNNSVSAQLSPNGNGGGIGGATGMPTGGTTGTTGTAAGGSYSSSSMSATTLGGSVYETVNNADSGFYKNIVKTIKTFLSKKGRMGISDHGQTIIVSDHIKNIRIIRKYIDTIQETFNKAVFLDFKIINVNLSKSFQFGINWNNLYQNIGSHALSGASLSLVTSSVPELSNQIVFNSGQGTQAVLQAMAGFGTVKIVNQAKLEVINSQTRTINDMEAVQYLEGTQTISTGALGSSTQTSPEFGTANSGISVVFTPIIEKNAVLVNVEMILNIIEGMNTYNVSGSTYNLPNVDTKSVAFSIYCPFGKTAIVGGLQYKNISKQDSGVPGLMNIPILGWLFDYKNDVISNNELFLMITPKLIKEGGYGK